MEKWISVIVVVIGAEHIEAKQCWAVDPARIGDCIADTVKWFAVQHGEAVKEIVVRPI